MGTLCCIAFFNKLDAGSWMDLIGLIVNGLLGLWIVRTLQNKLTNKRVLKDHFISEIRDIRNGYSEQFQAIYKGQLNPSTVLPWFKHMNIRVNEVMMFIFEKYKINLDSLRPFQNDLRDLITNNQDYINQNRNSTITFSDSSMRQFMDFQNNHNSIFNLLIIKINDAN